MVLKICLVEGALPSATPLHPPSPANQQDGRTPLHMAAQNGQLEVVRLLLGEGANKEAAEKVGAMWLPH